MKSICSSTANNEIVSGNKLAILDLYADSRGPGQAVLPVLEAVAGDNPEDVVIAKINANHNMNFVGQFKVICIPDVFFLKNNNIEDQFKGL